MLIRGRWKISFTNDDVKNPQNIICNRPCNENGGTMCGGNDGGTNMWNTNIAISVYRTNRPATGVYKTTLWIFLAGINLEYCVLFAFKFKETPLGVAVHLGCFRDAGDRDLKARMFEDTKSLTRDKCLRFCFGFRYAGKC